jgi:hypothetical protein
MHRTVKRLLGRVPTHHALHVRTQGAELRDLVVLILVHSYWASGDLCVLMVSHFYSIRMIKVRHALRTELSTPPIPAPRSSMSAISDCKKRLYCVLICTS